MKTNLTFGITLLSMAAMFILTLAQGVGLSAAAPAEQRVVRTVELEPVVIVSQRARQAAAARQTAQAGSDAAVHVQ